jgi:aspartyl-tRNA(Asn)/glutamyl-tRNA(Gln) amidotransferase subunit A
VTEVPGGPFTGVPLAELGRRLRTGATDPVELLDRALAAIDATQPALNAFVTVDAGGARAVAARRRDELARGADHGPLHGIPVAVKDIIDTAGLTTTMGSRHFATHIPRRDAEVVARLRAAGAVIVGKTTTHEFAYGPTGDRAAGGPAANPRDPGRMAGGSSAGSAAAVAAGLVPLALGTDTGGSVRIPAALCGVVGLRPSFGRVATTGVFPLSWSLDTVGPLAGSVADARVGWGVLTGARAADVGRPVSGLRLGVPTDGWFDRVDAGVGAAVEELVRRLAARGATIRPVPVPDAADLAHVYQAVQSAEAVSIHHERMADAPGLFEPETLDLLHAAAEVPAWDYARSLRRLGQLRARAVHRLADLDALVLPTVPIRAPLLGEREGDPGIGWPSVRAALLAFTTPWSVLGLPAVSVPLAASGLPVGAQLVGLPGGDEELLDVAASVEGVR